MFGFFEVIAGTKAVLPLVPGVITIVQKLKKQDKDPTLARMVEQIRLDTLESAQRMRTELITMLQDPTFDAQLKLPVKQLGDDLSYLKDPAKKRHVHKCRDRIQAIHRELTNSTDDLTSLLVCLQRTEGLGEALAVTEAVRESLDNVLSKQPPVREVLDAYIKALDDYIDKLGGQ